MPGRQVLVDGRQGRGVRLEERRGDRRQRASSANVGPKLLFERMFAPEPTCRPISHRRMTGFKAGSGTFRMNVALSRAAALHLPARSPASTTSRGIILAPTLDYMDARLPRREALRLVEGADRRDADPLDRRRQPRPARPACRQPVLPAVRARLPDGRCWDDAKDAAADLIIDTVEDHAPGFNASVLGRMILSPLDLERNFGLAGGDIMHGHMSLDQLWAARPVLGHGSYRAPVNGLYMCGAGTHPGGGVSGNPGHNAAREILRDRSLPTAIGLALRGR